MKIINTLMILKIVMLFIKKIENLCVILLNNKNGK